MTPCGRQQVCAEYYKLFCCLISHRLPSRRTSHFISSIQSFTGTVLPVTPGYFHRFTGTRRFPEEHAKHPSILSSDPRRSGLINCLLFFSLTFTLWSDLLQTESQSFQNPACITGALGSQYLLQSASEQLPHDVLE